MDLIIKKIEIAGWRTDEYDDRNLPPIWELERARQILDPLLRNSSVLLSTERGFNYVWNNSLVYRTGYSAGGAEVEQYHIAGEEVNVLSIVNSLKQALHKDRVRPYFVERSSEKFTVDPLDLQMVSSFSELEELLGLSLQE